MKATFRLVLVLLAAVLAVLGAACGAPPSRGIVVWHAYAGAEQKALEAVATRYARDHGVAVSLLGVPYEAYAAKLEAAIPRGNGPDIFISPHERLGTYLANRLVVAAGDAFPDADVARFDAVSVAAVTENGTRWGVPLATKCAALYVNEDLLPGPIGSLEELAAKKGTLGPSTYPITYEAQSVYYHVALLHAYGGRLFDGTTFAMVGEAAERAAEKARALTVSGAMPAEPDGGLVKQLFASGRAASVISGPWLAGDLPSTLRYRIVPLPSVEGVGPMQPYLTVDVAFLTPEGGEKADARAFVRALGDPASAKERAENGSQVVTTKSYWDALGAEPSGPLSRLAAFRAASANAIPMPSSVAMRATWVPALQGLRKALRGDATAREAFDEAKARYEDVMRPPPPPPSPAPLVALAGAALLALAIFAVRRASAPGFRSAVSRSLPAYAYVTHAAITILVLVVFPLLAGAATSFFAGTREEARFVGFTNYVEILTARGKDLLGHGSFYFTLLVTIAWTVVNVTLHVGIGLVLGVLLARPFLRLRAAYRVLLILPWAVPSYVTALAWKGMFHRQFGAVNALLSALGIAPLSWFSKFSTAFAANVATNVWLGFPFMMVVVMGALTSISKDVLEAAEVDGATRAQAFRLVTLPLLKPTLLPAVVLGSVWTFNMFNVVVLVSGGEPDGTTDILVSEAYRWAFARNAQLGYAAAYAVIIFGVLALMSRLVTRASKGAEA